jgi:hypothetical protein
MSIEAKKCKFLITLETQLEQGIIVGLRLVKSNMPN